jgi:polyhydroxyalkanoate synthase subunit PhaC
MPDPSNPAEGFAELFNAPQQLFAQLLPEMTGDAAAAGDLAHWSGVAQRLQAMWIEFQQEQTLKAAANPATALADPMRMFDALKRWTDALPLANPAVQQRLWDDSVALWQGVLGQYGRPTRMNPGSPSYRAATAASPIPNGASSRSLRWSTRPT